MDKDKVFKNMVCSAFDFFDKSIDYLEKDPKSSLINFCSSLELFMKARLMNEHWSLIVTKPQDANQKKFLSGNFQSVSLKDSLSRLENIASCSFGKEKEVFCELADYRNKTIHFFCEQNKKEDIVILELNAWFYLHKLLSGKWKETFFDWQSKIEKIDQKTKKMRNFLEVRYDKLKDKIKEQEESGKFIFKKCPSCGFESLCYEIEKESQMLAEDHYIVGENNCLVCDFTRKYLAIRCPDCEKIVYLKPEEGSTCDCGRTYDFSNSIFVDENEDFECIQDILDQGASDDAARAGDDYYNVGNCCDCGAYHSVVRTYRDECICLSCLSVFKCFYFCEWCHEAYTTPYGNSYFAGCDFCEGLWGEHKDD